MKKITIFYGMSFQKKNNQYFCNGAFGRFIDELSIKAETIILCVPVTSKELSNKGYQIKARNIHVVELPYYSGILDSLKETLSIKKIIKNNIQDWDNIYLRIPTPFSYYVFKLGKKYKKDMVLHIVGDTKEVVASGKKYKGFTRFLAKKVANYLEEVTFKLVEKLPTLVNGINLYNKYKKYPRVKNINTSTMFKKEIHYKESSSEKMGYKILYVGVLRHEKGLDYLLESLIDLLILNNNFKLTIVGDGPERENLEKFIEENNLTSFVEFKGFIPLGEELLEVYRNNDIFVLPSISEGTPRVLTEAMANGLAIVATDVGGIPSLINNEFKNGILVPSKNAEKIKEAILNYTKDEELYNQTVENGYRFAENNTLENHVNEVTEFMIENNFK